MAKSQSIRTNKGSRGDFVSSSPFSQPLPVALKDATTPQPA